MNPIEAAKQLSRAQRDGILLMGNPEASAGTLSGQLISDFMELQILHKRDDGVIGFSDFGRQVLAAVRTDEK